MPGKTSPKTRQMPLAQIKPYARNARNIPQSAVDAVARSIREFGWKQPIVVDAKNVIIAGHTRYKAARKLELTNAPVIIADDLTPDQVKAYRLADNRTGEIASWDSALLLDELGELGDINMGALGFEAHVMHAAGGDLSPAPKPDTPAETDIQPGDIWHLGDHRLLVGDSMDAECRATALADDRPHLVVTDPPYGVKLDKIRNTRRRMSKGAMRNMSGSVGGDHAYSVGADGDTHTDFADAMYLPCAHVFYTWMGQRQAAEHIHHRLAEHGIDWRVTLIWVKTFPVMSPAGHYSSGHEMCLYSRRRGAPSHWQSPTRQKGARLNSTVMEPDDYTDVDALEHAAVIRAASIRMAGGHPTQKPIECMARPIRYSSAPGDHIWEPFLGSGTTLMACERERRKCIGMELHPPYAQMTINRWQDETGQVATRA